MSSTLPKIAPHLTKKHLKLTESKSSTRATISFQAPTPSKISTDDFKQELCKLIDKYSPSGSTLGSTYPLDELEEYDMLMSFDVKLTTKSGEAVRVKGHSVLNNILSEQGLPEAPDLLQSAHYTSIWRPLRGKVIEFLQRQTLRDRRLPLAEGSMSDYDPTNSPSIPTAYEYTGSDPASLSEEPAYT